VPDNAGKEQNFGPECFGKGKLGTKDLAQRPPLGEGKKRDSLQPKNLYGKKEVKAKGKKLTGARKKESIHMPGYLRRREKLPPCPFITQPRGTSAA